MATQIACEAPFHTQARTPTSPAVWTTAHAGGTTWSPKPKSKMRTALVWGGGGGTPSGASAAAGTGGGASRYRLVGHRTVSAAATCSGWHSGQGAGRPQPLLARSPPTACAMLAVAQELCFCDFPKQSPASSTGGHVQRDPWIPGRGRRPGSAPRPPLEHAALLSGVHVPCHCSAYPAKWHHCQVTHSNSGGCCGSPGAGLPPCSAAERSVWGSSRPISFGPPLDRGTCPSESGVGSCANPHMLSRGPPPTRGGEASLPHCEAPWPNAP